MIEHSLWAEHAWIAGRWQDSVLLKVNESGYWESISPNVTTPPAQARRLSGPVLPGLVNAHSHAFQRAFAGLAERRDTAADNFWSWRDRMYQVALRISPEQLQAVAAQLYLELMRGGYTQTCEFHYLHHDLTGLPYPDPSRMCWSMAEAAHETGMGLTILPVLYHRAGFNQVHLRADQRRFTTTPAQVHQLMRAVQSSPRKLVNAGVAIHSLRAASTESIQELLRLVDGENLPLHIHIAEQTSEVDECLAHTGQRPIEYLCQNFETDTQWQLIHATHATPLEIEAVARTGGGIVLCPGTEANLGDGLTDVTAWLDAAVPMAIGSDSQIIRNWPEELRWLEYGQRLNLRKRNVTAWPGHQASTAARLFDAALSASAAPAGYQRWGLLAGARADALVLNSSSDALLGMPSSHLLDGLVFNSSEPKFSEVLIAGEVKLHEQRHVNEEAIALRFKQVMHELWESPS